MPKMPLAASSISCLYSQRRRPSFRQPLGLLPCSKTLSPVLQEHKHSASHLLLDPQPIPFTALLSPILQPERQPTERCPLYPEQVLRAPPDRHPANRCDQTPGTLGRRLVCKWFWSYLSLFPIPTSEIPGELPQPPPDHVFLPQLPRHGKVQVLDAWVF